MKPGRALCRKLFCSIGISISCTPLIRGEDDASCRRYHEKSSLNTRFSGITGNHLWSKDTSSAPKYCVKLSHIFMTATPKTSTASSRTDLWYHTQCFSPIWARRKRYGFDINRSQVMTKTAHRMPTGSVDGKRSQSLPDLRVWLGLILAFIQLIVGSRHRSRDACATARR